MTIIEEAEQRMGHALRTLRLGRGLSQQQMARQMTELGHTNWHQTTVAKTELAQRPVRVSELVSLAAILDIPSIDMLIDPVSIQEAIRITVIARISDLQNELRALIGDE